MVSQKDKFQKHFQDACNYISKVSSNGAFIGVLDSGLVDEIQQTLTNFGNETKKMAKTWKIRTKTKIEDERVKDIDFPFLLGLFDSYIARFELARESEFRTSKEKFELNLQAEDLKIEDIDSVVDDFHKYVESYFRAQKDLPDMSEFSVNTTKIDEYRRTCEAIIYILDKKASKQFNTKIHTPADFDPKEKNPHWFLGQINVGFEQYEPNLVTSIGHEGPFGHNTNQQLSEYLAYNFAFRHANEGLAILGEFMALDLYYSDDIPGKEEIIFFLKQERTMNDALGAAFEKLAFYDCHSKEDIADKLDSRLISKKKLLQRLTRLDEGRDEKFDFGGTNYYAGRKLIVPIYTDAVDTIESLSKGNRDFFNYNTKAVWYKLFSGHRSVRTMERQTLHFLDNLKSPETKKGQLKLL